MRFSTALPDDSPYAPREVLAGKDARQLTRAVLQMSPEEFSRAFSKSPMKRAKLRGLKRNAAVVLGNLGTAEDADVLELALDDPEPLVRAHAASALERFAGHSPSHDARSTPPRRTERRPSEPATKRLRLKVVVPA